METTILSNCEIQDHIELDYDFSTLPPHVLAQILSYLGLNDFRNASQTCKQWYYASCDPRSSNQIFLYFTSEQIDSMDIFVRPVTQICFDQINFNKFDYKKLLKKFEHKITELYIRSCDRLRITQLFEMLIYLPNLKVLRMLYGSRYFKLNNFYNHRRITKHMDKIKQSLSGVEELYIKTTEKDLKGVEILLNYCTNLKKLHWNEDFCHEKLDHFLINVLVNSKNNLLPECLESLSVHSIDRKQNSEFFEKLIKLNRINLRSLELKEISETYYDVMFKEFCKTYKLLERLTMYGSNNQQLADICKYMRNLKMLNLDNATVTNFSLIGYLNNLENFIARQSVETSNDSLIELFRLKPTNLTDLTLNRITSGMLKELCENLPQLKRLRLENIETKECEPIFRHLTKLVYIHLDFTENSQINSKKIESDPEWNVTKLVDLEYLFVSTYLPGFTPALITKLPKLKTNFDYDMYDVPERENVEQENDEENENEDVDENENGEENGDDNENEDNDENGDDNDENEDEDNEPEESIEEENRQYDLNEFDVLSMWVCDTDTKEILVNDSAANSLNTHQLSLLHIFNWLTVQQWQKFKLKSWIADVFYGFRDKASEFLLNFKHRKL